MSALPSTGVGMVFNSAIPERSAEIAALTGLRGFAALWVLLYHAWGQSGVGQIGMTFGEFQLDLTPFFRMGGAGVSIFFVLSGFLLALPFAQWQAGLRGKPTTGKYLLKRVLRVFPAYYVQLAILLIIAYYSHGREAIPSAQDMVRHLLMLFTPPPLGVEPKNGVWWTLPIEFSFYLALPFLAPLLRASRLPWLLATSFALMVIWRHLMVLWLADAPIPVRVNASYQLPGSMDMFGLGMCAAVTFVNREHLPAWSRIPFNADRSAAFGLILVIVSIYWLNGAAGEYWADNPIFYLWTPSLSLGVVAVLLAGTTGGRLANVLFGNRFMIFSGMVSYSVYLWHFPILVWIKQAGFMDSVDHFRLPVLLLVALPLTLAVAATSYFLIERPFMRLRPGA